MTTRMASSRSRKIDLQPESILIVFVRNYFILKWRNSRNIDSRPWNMKLVHDLENMKLVGLATQKTFYKRNTHIVEDIELSIGRETIRHRFVWWSWKQDEQGWTIFIHGKFLPILKFPSEMLGAGFATLFARVADVYLKK